MANNDIRKALGNVVITGKNTAITEKIAGSLGVLEAFTQWKLNVNTLYDFACEYAEYFNDGDRTTSDKKLVDAERKVWNQWLRVLRFGEEDMIHPKMFIRPQDVETLRTWASGMVIIQTAHNRVFARTGETQFRKYVETLVYTRATCAGILSDADRDTYNKYTATARAIKSAKTFLNGDKKTTGAKKHLETLKAELEELKEILDAAGIEPEKVAIITAGKEVEINNLTKQIATTEETLKANEDDLKELAPAYTKVLATIESIEGFDD